MFDDSIKDLLGFNARTLYEEYNLANNSVDILSFDNIFLECDFAQSLIFKRKRSAIIHNFTWMLIRGINTLKNFVVEYNGILWNQKT